MSRTVIGNRGSEDGGLGRVHGDRAAPARAGQAASLQTSRRAAIWDHSNSLLVADGGPRAVAAPGTSPIRASSPWARILAMTSGSAMLAMIRTVPPQCSQR